MLVCTYKLDGFNKSKRARKVVLRSCLIIETLLYANGRMGTIAQTLACQSTRVQDLVPPLSSNVRVNPSSSA